MCLSGPRVHSHGIEDKANQNLLRTRRQIDFPKGPPRDIGPNSWCLILLYRNICLFNLDLVITLKKNSFVPLSSQTPFPKLFDN